MKGNDAEGVSVDVVDRGIMGHRLIFSLVLDNNTWNFTLILSLFNS